MNQFFSLAQNDSDAKRLIKFFFIVSVFLWNCRNAETSAWKPNLIAAKFARISPTEFNITYYSANIFSFT